MTIQSKIMKLVLVTVNFRGCSISQIMSCEMKGERAQIPESILDRMATNLGWTQGQTYSIG